LAKPARDISQQLMRRLYLGVAILKMIYALKVWYEPLTCKQGARRSTGSVRALKKMEKPLKFTSVDPILIETKIAGSREESILSEMVNTAKYKIFSDGSGYKGQAGAVAVLIKAGSSTLLKTLHYHLSSLKEHMMYEAEVVGAIIVVHLMKDVI
ncbi:hypothetical protein AN958_08607, partial [Leucoagaricus sp. SymC.cos]